MSSVHADVLTASSRSRACTSVLTAVVQMCAVPGLCPSPCANVYTAIQRCNSSMCGYTQASCPLAATVQTAMKPHLQKGFAAGSLGLPAYAYLTAMLLLHPKEPSHNWCHEVCAQHPKRSVDVCKWDSLPKAVVQATAKTIEGGNKEGKMQVRNPLNWPSQENVLIYFDQDFPLRWLS